MSVIDVVYHEKLLGLKRGKCMCTSVTNVTQTRPYLPEGGGNESVDRGLQFADILHLPNQLRDF